jgi:hypothetical protein
VSHLNSGLRILAEIYNKSTTTMAKTPYVSLRDLALLFIRVDGIDIELRALNTFQPQTITESVQHTSSESAERSPTLDSLEQTRLALEKLRINASQRDWSKKEQSTFIPELHALSTERSIIAKVRRYNQALEHYIYLNENHNFNKQDQYTIHDIKLNVILISMNVTGSVAAELENECSWYEWSSKCKEVMEYAETVVLHPETTTAPPPGLDRGIIWLLAFVAIKCEGNAVGRRALEIMRISERLEGVWNSFVAADVVEKLLQQGRESGRADERTENFNVTLGSWTDLGVPRRRQGAWCNDLVSREVGGIIWIL